MTEASQSPDTATSSEPESTAVPLHDLQPSHEIFRDDVWEGLARSPKQLPSKYFYDAEGCALFDQICELEEYYLTRTESDIMRRAGGEIAEQVGKDCLLIEYGSGSSIKTRLLLDAIRQPVAYVPVDIARDHLHQTAQQLSDAYEQLLVLPVCADFTQPFDVPEPPRPPRRRVVYFPGSTIGNLRHDEASRLLQQMAGVAGSGGGLLIGIDLKKDPAVLEAAYNDAAGVTARFNLNLLARINRELDADFDEAAFEHRAVYNAGEGRVEMLLISQRRQQVQVAGRRFELAAGEAICTEYSHKYHVDEFGELAAAAGWSLRTAWTDPRKLFAVVFLEVASS